MLKLLIIFVNELKTQFETFKDTGASIDEMHRSSPYTDRKDNQRAVMISWVGPHERNRLIHLNEHGYDRNGKKVVPRGFWRNRKNIRRYKGTI
ncbi:putative phiSLT protein [Staphylococcus gallinarum]|uniref:Putative phiSLT protein n=1 Tax=Staphylococcus gallinarum TaxID=1293 RepID=A0A380FEX9_STAGA|nr:putative phiSLT protein [Staphylococcus gallinarum]